MDNHGSLPCKWNILIRLLSIFPLFMSEIFHDAFVPEVWVLKRTEKSWTNLCPVNLLSQNITKSRNISFLSLCKRICHIQRCDSSSIADSWPSCPQISSKKKTTEGFLHRSPQHGGLQCNFKIPAATWTPPLLQSLGSELGLKCAKFLPSAYAPTTPARCVLCSTLCITLWVVIATPDPWRNILG